MATLAEELKRLRALKDWSLRQVEAKTEGRVSNSYLYQLENGAVKEPSPHVLFELSKAYGVPYASLMSVAGYVVPKAGKPGRISIAFNALNLNKEEEQEVMDFIEVRRKQKYKKGV